MKKIMLEEKGRKEVVLPLLGSFPNELSGMLTNEFSGMYDASPHWHNHAEGLVGPTTVLY